jgi:hypothetical protein
VTPLAASGEFLVKRMMDLKVIYITPAHLGDWRSENEVISALAQKFAPN